MLLTVMDVVALCSEGMNDSSWNDKEQFKTVLYLHIYIAVQSLKKDKLYSKTNQKCYMII